MLLLVSLPRGAGGVRAAKQTMAARESQKTTVPTERDERLWREAQKIHRRAIVVDGHNDITTPMTNHDYDLSGQPPFPYRTSLERMKQGADRRVLLHPREEVVRRQRRSVALWT